MADNLGNVTRLNWPPELGSAGGSLNHWVDFHSYDFKHKKKKTEIALYIPPDALSTEYKSEYKNLEMGAGGMKAAEEVKDAESDVGAVTKSLAAMGMAQWSLGMEGLRDSLATLLPETMEALAMRAKGRSVNPHLVTQYQGPTQHREHKFTFQMMPKSRIESQTVNQIVKEFKKGMLPDHTSAASPVTPIGAFGYPDEYEITFFINGEAQDSGNNGLFRIGRSALTDVSLDYTTQDTVAFFEDANYPVSVEMTLTFLETHLMYRGLIEKGF